MSLFASLRRGLARALLAPFGWKVRGALPDASKYVLIAAPHTSNWDLPLMLVAALYYGIRVSWLGKHTLFRFPWGPLSRLAGGVAIDRRFKGDNVNRMKDLFDSRPRLALAVPPEGTRARREVWKSGFYVIASAANVPIVLGFLDWGTRTMGMGPAIAPSGDVSADMDQIRAFYAGMRGRYPQGFAEPRLRLEDEQASAASQ